jgi:beta-lactamase superfamily II metal-dependent hydrolase
MPEAENDGDIEVDLLDVGIQDINLVGSNEDLSNWTRADKEGTSGDASVINQVRGEAVLEPDDAVLLDEDDDDEDDTYIDDGVVAPIVVESIEDDFFV